MSPIVGRGLPALTEPRDLMIDFEVHNETKRFSVRPEGGCKPAPTNAATF